jgi:PII-like signaling protein
LSILAEIVDLEEKIDTIKPKLDEIITQGLITEKKLKLYFMTTTKRNEIFVTIALRSELGNQ